MASVETLIDIAPLFAGQVDEECLRQAVEAALRAGAEGTAETSDDRDLVVSVRVTDSEEMRRINREYRHVDKPTDVLSFSFLANPHGPEIELPPEWPIELGEVILCWPWIERQAEELDYAVDTELAWLTIHGVLQLLGYGHETDEEAAHMEALEKEALASLGLRVD